MNRIYPLHTLLLLCGFTILSTPDLTAMEQSPPMHKVVERVLQQSHLKKRKPRPYTPSSRAEPRFNFRRDFESPLPQEVSDASAQDMDPENSNVESDTSETDTSDPEQDSMPNLELSCHVTPNHERLEAVSAPIREAIEREAALLAETINKTLELFAQKEKDLLRQRIAQQISGQQWLAAMYANEQERELELMRIQKEFHEISQELHNKLCEEIRESAPSLIAYYV